MKVSELTGAVLDLWVARAEGWALDQEDHFYRKDGEGSIYCGDYMPSEDWAHGGPILERERISVGPCGTIAGVQQWFAKLGDHAWGSGTEYLVAGMRAYVMHKFGGTVPDEADT